MSQQTVNLNDLRNTLIDLWMAYQAARFQAMEAEHSYSDGKITLDQWHAARALEDRTRSEVFDAMNAIGRDE